MQYGLVFYEWFPINKFYLSVAGSEDQDPGYEVECNTAGYLHSVFPLYGKMTSLSYNKIH
jgi:hypothetical protein